ncbi:IclR family transcriptional regulator [Microbacterium aoyamense]|uniref:IclR family transcriptional regulator n=1 Tax=Microbacterium aoyamense TaxID=344166 RepID=A0ABN2PCV2_9MICO|nr:IclR family transcriptional regulator [Microbacterium aoyamense]
MSSPEVAKLVGSDRVLAVLIELAEHPAGATLDELTQALQSPKSTIHRALTSLRTARLATQLSRGVYVLGDEFIRLAFENYAARPDAALVEPILRALSERFGETAHYAVLEGPDVVYRAKVDPPAGAMRLTSVVGGRNPAYRTAVGKLLLADTVRSESELRRVVGEQPLEKRTPRTETDPAALWAELQRIRELGYAVDDQENEPGVNCVAVPLRLGDDLPARGAVSVSAVAFRLPLAELVARVDEVRAITADPRTA